MPTKAKAKAKSKATAANITVIKINPNISGSGMYYAIWGDGNPTPIASGSALNGLVPVSVSGYDQYNVGFVGATGNPFTGGVFSTPKPVAITGDATVTLAITVSQG
jgi:hypothetical protein